MNDRIRWLIVAVYAMAMAWVESAVVLYLRTMVNRIEPYQANPLPILAGLARVEVAREAATLIMLLTVGMLAGRTWRSRMGYAAIAFGVWDIFYYVFLKVMCGWPHSVLDWDVLFLIPFPWWSPVLAPMLIASLMILWGTLVSQVEDPELPGGPRLAGWTLHAFGIFLALGVFMADAITALPHGAAAVRNVLPTAFHWTAFCAALLLIATPIVQILWALALPRPIAFKTTQEVI